MKSTLNQNPTHDLIIHLCFPPGWKITRLALSQFFSAFILTYCVMDSYPKTESNFELYSQCSYIALSMFFTFVLFGQLSGGQGNPIITIALFFNKGSGMNIFKFLICVIAQYVGSLAGGAVAFGTVSPFGVPLYNGSDLPQTFGVQLIATFFFICLYFMIMSASTRFQSNFWCYFLVPMAYYLSCMVSFQYVGMNPVTAFANQLYFGISTHQWDALKSYWVFICGPAIGSVIGSVFMNFFIIPLYKNQQVENKQ